MTTAAWTHRTVLLPEATDAVVTRRDGIYVDGTFGRGGHARNLLSKLGPTARLIAFDRDPQAIAAATEGDAAIHDPRFSIHHADFREMAEVLATLGVPAVSGVLLDVGVSSPQIDDPARGFSFRHDGPLDMRMDPTRGESVADYLGRVDERELAQVIRDLGEERFAGAVAKAVVARREQGRAVRTTAELSDVVARAVKTREPGQDPATRTFQALRIHVNGELEALTQALSAALSMLETGGRLAVISFHSLEDRIVKTFIARESTATVDRRAPFAEPRPTRMKAIARIRPSADEVAANPRARSAMLRVAERTDVPFDAVPPPAAVAAAPKRGATSGARRRAAGASR